MGGKIGFITGVGGNPTGIGQFVQDLDAAGVPAVIMANDTTTGLSDILNLNTNVPHVAQYRVVYPDETKPKEYFSVPNYDLSPVQAANDHWNKIEPYFQQDVRDNRDRVWIQPVNEVDKSRASWLGYFGVEIAKIANIQGYKVAMFAWSSGEPEPEHWRTPGMVSYLQYCHVHHDMAGVAVHEYDYGHIGMANTYPFHIGRFQAMFAACDEMGLKRPKTLVTEFGWSQYDVPGLEQVLDDIDFASTVYRQYPEILGAGIWYLGPGYNDIANKVNPLIPHVKEYNLSVQDEEKCDAREPFAREYWVANPGMSKEDFMKLAGEAYDDSRRTVGFSYDDAGIGCGLTSRKAVLFNIDPSQEQVFVDWYNTNYQGTEVEFRNFP